MAEIKYEIVKNIGVLSKAALPHPSPNATLEFRIITGYLIVAFGDGARKGG